MLDKSTASLLEYINRVCEDGGYKVIDYNDIIESLPSKFSLDIEGIQNDFKYLDEREYLKIKYSDDTVVCVCPLPKGKLYNEQRVDAKQDDSSKFRKFMIYSFLGAMTGSIIGSVFVALVTALIG